MFENELNYITDYLKKNLGNNSYRDFETFRKRSEHSLNVFHWVLRLYETYKNEWKEKINIDNVCLAALFHDVGYVNQMHGKEHAIYSGKVWLEYAQLNKYSNEVIEDVYNLIIQHSNKELLMNKSTSKELILLMEADWLDEEGAMSIVRDCLTLGGMNPQSYEEALLRIKKYSSHILNHNPMVSFAARKFWRQKQKIVINFINDLESDLFLNLDSVGINN